MTFEVPESFWPKAPNVGAQRMLFDTPEELWEKATEYFTWIDTHPLKEQVVFHHKGIITKTMVSKSRPYTKKGLCIFLGIAENGYKLYQARPEFQPATDLIDTIIYNQKFEGAAVGFFNAGIIARDLGLADRTELTGPNGGPVQTITGEMTPQEAAEAYAATLQGEQG